MDENAVEEPRLPSPEDIDEAEKYKEKANELFRSTYHNNWLL